MRHIPSISTSGPLEEFVWDAARPTSGVTVSPLPLPLPRMLPQWHNFPRNVCLLPHDAKLLPDFRAKMLCSCRILVLAQCRASFRSILILSLIYCCVLCTGQVVRVPIYTYFLELLKTTKGVKSEETAGGGGGGGGGYRTL
jgi:hypothetical protein